MAKSRNRGGVQVDSTFQGAEQSLGTAEGILEAVSTTLARDDIIRIFYSNMVKEFDTYASAAARAMPDKFGHMYDWKQLGFKSGKLWQDHLIGGKGQRSITFSFLPSTNSVPATTPENTGIKQADFPNLSSRNGKYKFPNKAMVFETGKRVTIKPRNNDRLFVPLKHKTRSGWREVDFGGQLSERDKQRGFVWAKKTVQDHSDTAGNFSGLYLAFYSEQSGRVWQEKVEPRINERIRKVYLRNMPNLGGGTAVNRSKVAAKHTFNPSAVVNYKSRVHAEYNREMRGLVREAKEMSNDDTD